MTHPAVDKLRGVLHLPMPRRMAPVYDSEIAQVFVEVGLLGFLAWYGLRLLIVCRPFSAFRLAHRARCEQFCWRAPWYKIPYSSCRLFSTTTANFLVFAAWAWP